MHQVTESAYLTSRTRVSESPLHGRGVFVCVRIREGEVVIDNPALPLGEGDVRETDVIARYCFEWPFDGDGRAVALGEASLLNHAPGDERGKRGPNGHHLRANLRWETDMVANRIVFYALRDIEAGEECLIDYGADYPWDGHGAAG